MFYAARGKLVHKVISTDLKEVIKKKPFSQKEKQVPKTLNYNMCGMFKEQPGRQCARKRMSKGKKSKRLVRKEIWVRYGGSYVSSALPG